jgi:hypothetical protein
MLKQSIIFLSISILLCGFNAPILHAQANDERQVVLNLFQYMQAGNTDGILSIMTDPILSAKKPIFQKKSYSAFLRKHYSAAELLIEKIERTGAEKSSIDISIDFKDEGPPLKTRYILVQDNGLWKISNEITDGP